MQNLISSGPDPVTTAIIENHLNTKPEEEPANKSVSATDIDTPMAQQENGTPAEAPASTADTPAENETAVPPLTQPSDNTERMDSASKSNSNIDPGPKINSNPGCDAQKAKNQNKVDGRKYVPSKKAMVDPLKIDLSKPVVNPLTSSQLSLQCFQCHIIFSDHKSKQRHLKLSHPAEYEQSVLRNALFACYVCDRQFTNSTELMAHQKAHTEKKPFKCPICVQAFKRSSELTLHKKIHVGYDGYACIDCGKPCKTITLLKYHRRTHTGERPYVCQECGRRFSSSKGLQKHTVSHLPEGAQANKDVKKVKAQMKKDDGPAIKYPCYICKATFKTTKTRLHHMKTKHKASLAANSNGISAVQQVTQSTPIITPISICQPALLQLEPNGPLQKVDAVIDTEQICRLIESLGNVQKVNQVVILGQVPPHAPPLEVQQTSHLGEPGNLNPKQLQIDCLELKKMESKTVELTPSNNICDSMEQTIILEPITPDGQLENPSFSGVGSQIATGDNMGLKQTQSKTVELNASHNVCDSMEQIIILEPIAPDGQLENPSLSEVGSQIATGENMGLKPTESKTVELNHSHKVCCSMEQTIILEPIAPDGQLKTPTFSGVASHIAADENMLQPEQTMQHGGDIMHEILQQPHIGEAQPNSIDLGNMEQTVILELTPALIPTVELEQSQIMPQNEPPSCVLVPNTEVEKNPDQPVEAEQEITLSVPPLLHATDLKLSSLRGEQEELPPCPSVPLDALTKIPDESDTNPIERSDLQKQRVCLGQVQPLLNGAKTQGNTELEASEKVQAGRKEGQEQVENLSEDPSAKQVPQIPLNEMSAQELVKVRKRKPARGHFFQEYIHELVGSIYKDDLCINAKPAKRQRTKKSHIVVKFASQSKEKKNERKSSQQRKRTQEDGITSKAPTTNLSEKKRSQKKGKGGKMGKKAGHLVSAGEKKSPSPIQEPLVKQIKKCPRKNKMKQQKEVATECVTCVGEHKTVDSSLFPKAKKGKVVKKVQPKNATVVKRKKTRVEEEEKTRSASTDLPGSHVTQDALLLLKGHKQPQLKVYKLDTSAASGHTPETSPKDSKMLGKNNRHSKSESKIDVTSEDKKKGGQPKKNQKALLLSSLKGSHQPPETLPTKPKTTRKRKASSKLETEGVITSSHSKRALECNECGERFSEVSTLQNHKATLHIIESPGLTYTNGNVFEGVTSLALYQLPKKDPRVGAMMNAASGWDTEPEIGEMALDDRETCVSFPALIPSPSLPVPPSHVEMNDREDTGASKIRVELPPSDQIKNHETHQSFETAKPFTSVGNKGEAGTPRNPTTEAEVHGPVDEDIKEDLLLEVDLVTVGEQCENDHPTSHEDTIPQKESSGTGNSETESLTQVSNKAENCQTSRAVSCLPHHIDVKEEEDEISIQKIKGAGMRNVTKRQRTDDHCDVVSKKKALARKAVRETQLEKDQQECEVVYEQHTLSSDSEINDDSEAGTKKSKVETTEANKTSAPDKSSPSVPSKLVESAEEQVVELMAFNTSVEEVRDDSRLRREEQTEDPFPGILTEKFITSRQQTTADKVLCHTEMNGQKEVLDAIAENEVHIVGSHMIKVEEIMSDPQQVAASCQNKQNVFVQPQRHLDIRAVLVKEENNLVLNEGQATPARRIRWNVEPVSNENTSSTFPEHAESSRECRLTPLFSTSQCIFYPVKEENRELPLGISETNSANSTTGTTISPLHTECQTTDSSFDEESHSAVGNERMKLSSEPRVNDFSEGQVEVDADGQQPQNLQDLLLQSSEEEDVGAFEFSDPQLDSEAEIMAYFNKNQTSNTQHSDEVSTNLPTSTSQLQTPRVENIMKEPIDYFSNYFGWDAWVEIANCTITLSNMPKPVTAREVAQFVGIHIAMGTLKFPSPKLYWEDLTKVPLIAESMPQARFLELCRVLRFASPPEDSVHSSVQERRHDSDFQNVPQDTNPSSSQNALSQQGQKDVLNDTNCPKTQGDPLWKAQPLLGRFKAGCHSLRQDGDYAVDQYPLPLPGKLLIKKQSLCCTTLIGFGGFLLHVDLKSGSSSKEDAVENLVPRGSMVFLCKQELSTPAVLERLLVAGVHGAGRVGGARGQIGDEFVSSDGKLMLQRSQCGFILSTAGNSQKNMASLTDNFEKAQMSAHVNRDLRNLYCTPLTVSSPTCWPQVVLWYLTDLALINSWLLYRQDHRAASAPLSLMAFRLEVSKALILSRDCDTQDSVPPQVPIKKTHAAKETPSTNLAEESPLPDAATRYDGLGHWPEQLGEEEGGRCRFRDCQRTSRVLCLKCCVFLCISRNNNCFLKFHEGSMGKEQC